MAQAILGRRGQLTLPQEVLEATQAQPGNSGAVEVADRGTIVLRIQHARTRDPEREQQRPIGVSDLIGGRGEAPVKYDELPILTLEDMLERYRIAGPVDPEVDREAWYDEMAKDVFGERPDRFPS